MAELPTTEEIQKWIFEEIHLSGRSPRADEIAFQIMQMQLALHNRGVRAEEYSAALNAMVETGLLSPAKSGSFMMLTVAGFDRL